MNCAGCSEPLLRREDVQPSRVGGRLVYPPAFCDDCCRGFLWRGGDPEAIERLIRGEVDPLEVARLNAELGPATVFPS